MLSTLHTWNTSKWQNVDDDDNVDDCDDDDEKKAEHWQVAGMKVYSYIWIPHSSVCEFIVRKNFWNAN